MAIIDRVEITISSGGNVVQEYDVPTDDDVVIDDDRSGSTKVVKYIEAVPGANFEINYSVKQGQDFGGADYLALDTLVDGQKVLAPIIWPRYLNGGNWAATREGSQSGTGRNWNVEPYSWTELLLTDEKPNATVAEIKAKYGKIGSIQVDFSRKKELGVVHEFKPVSLHEKPIPEKAFKGQAVELGIGEVKINCLIFKQARRKGSPVVVHKGKCIDDGPVSTFIFQYRSKNALQILGVLPCTPEPIPLEDRDPELLTREELVEIARRQQAQWVVEKVKLKQEKTEANLRQFAIMGVKREALRDKEGYNEDGNEDNLSIGSQPKKRSRREIETIDLTDD